MREIEKAMRGVEVEIVSVDQCFSNRDVHRNHLLAFRILSRNAKSGAVGLGWGLRCCVSDKLPGDAHAAETQTVVSAAPDINHSSVEEKHIALAREAAGPKERIFASCCFLFRWGSRLRWKIQEGREQPLLLGGGSSWNTELGRNWTWVGDT